MASTEMMTGMDDERGAAVEEQPDKPKKPRGKCTGCAFGYQLGTARTGEHKGKLVIRKHLSRTRPGLCPGAQQPPEVEHTTGCTEEERFGPSVCSGCDDAGLIVSQVQSVDCEGRPTLAETVTYADTSLNHPKSSAGHCVPSRCEGCCGCSQMCTTDPSGWPHGSVAPVGTPTVAEPADLVGAIAGDPFTAPAVVGGMTDDARAAAYGHPVSDQDVTPGAVPDPFTAPAPASDIPESTTTVSGQPEPDRDRWGRYLIMGQAHTRATTFAKLGANTKAIEAWNERNVIRGLTLRPDLLMLANGLEVKRDREQLNSIAAQAKDAAGSKVAANIGTAYHAFSERLDAGLMSLADVPTEYRHRVDQYLCRINGAGLRTRPEWIERTTAVRADQISAPLPVAGTLDRIFQLPDGSLVIGDLKTGSDLSYGEMEIEVQLALYAHGVNTHGLFDWNTKTWQDWESDQDEPRLKVRTDIAIVIHLPADGDGCTLYVADIERGWRDAQRLGQLQASLKDKPKGKRFRTLTAADLAPRPAEDPGEQGWAALEARVEQQYPTTPVKEEPKLPVPPSGPSTPDAWEHAKELFSTAPDQATVAQLYQYAMDSGKFHVDQLAVLVGLGKDRLNALAKRG